MNFPGFDTMNDAALWRAQFSTPEECDRYLESGQRVGSRPAPLVSLAPAHITYVVDLLGAECPMCEVGTVSGRSFIVPYPRQAIVVGIGQLAARVREQNERAEQQRRLREELAGRG